MLCCLEGVRILEYTDTPAGAYCARLLADLGAEVIKVEPPSGERSRARPPFFGDQPHPERSCLFFYLNLNKMGVTLDLGSTTGREIFAKLALQTDVVIEDQPADDAGRFGLDPATLLGLNPRLVVGSVTPFGRCGPHSHFKAYPLNLYHAGGDGYLLQSGKEYFDREPIKAGGLAGEYEAAGQAAVAVLIALRHARRTGVGQHVDVSKQQSLMALNRSVITSPPNGDPVESRATRGYPYAGTLPCKDGWVVMQIPAQYMWDRVVAMMGAPEWTKDVRFGDEESRAANGDELNELLRRWLRDYTKNEICRMARDWGVPVAPVSTAADLVASEQLRHRQFFLEVEHPVLGKVVCPSTAFIMSGVPSQATMPPPLLGQHNRQIYVGRLGYQETELGRLRGCGVI